MVCSFGIEDPAVVGVNEVPAGVEPFDVIGDGAVVEPGQLLRVVRCRTPTKQSREQGQAGD